MGCAWFACGQANQCGMAKAEVELVGVGDLDRVRLRERAEIRCAMPIGDGKRVSSMSITN